MLVEVYNVRARVVTGSPDELGWLQDYLELDKPSKYTRDKRRTSLLKPSNLSFPAGLLEMVRAAAREDGLRVEVADMRRPPCRPDPAVRLDWLTDYQELAVELAAADAPRGVFDCPTASGKTEVLSALAALYRCRHVALVPEKSLVAELADRFHRRTGEAAGTVVDKRWVLNRVTVAFFGTVHAALAADDVRAHRLLHEAEALHVDECHALAAPTRLRVVEECRNAYFRWGYSATPFARADRRGIHVVGALGPVIYRVAPEVLVERGAVAKGTVNLLPLPVAPYFARDYADAYRRLVEDGRERNAMFLDLFRRRVVATPALLFVRTLGHGHWFANELRRVCGLRTRFIYGEAKAAERTAAERDLDSGALDVVVANKVFHAGINVPTLASVVNAGAGKAHIGIVQMAGRAARRRDREGNVVKDAFTAYDTLERDCGCGVARGDGTREYRHLPCKWFTDHAAERRASYLDAGFTVVERADLARGADGGL